MVEPIRWYLFYHNFILVDFESSIAEYRQWNVLISLKKWRKFTSYIHSCVSIRIKMVFNVISLSNDHKRTFVHCKEKSCGTSDNYDRISGTIPWTDSQEVLIQIGLKRFKYFTWYTANVFQPVAEVDRARSNTGLSIDILMQFLPELKLFQCCDHFFTKSAFMDFGNTARDNDLLTIFVTGLIRISWYSFASHAGIDQCPEVIR